MCYTLKSTCELKILFPMLIPNHVFVWFFQFCSPPFFLDFVTTGIGQWLGTNNKFALCRVRTERQQSQGCSLSEQEFGMAKICKENGLNVVKVIKMHELLCIPLKLKKTLRAVHFPRPLFSILLRRALVNG